jgi:hypothetical protein
MTDRLLRIPFLPDLSMPKYKARYGAQAIVRACGAVADLTALLDAADGEWSLLRYLYLPSIHHPQDRLQLFLRIHTTKGQRRERDFASGQHLLDEFYASQESSAKDALGELDIEQGSLFLVQRAEEVLHDPEEDILYYAPLPYPAGLPGIVESMNLDVLLHSLQAPCIIDLAVKPSKMTPDEGQSLLMMLKELDRHASAFDPERRDSGSMEDLVKQRDVLASRHRDFYQQYFDTLYSGRIYECVVRVFSNDKREGALVARSLGEALSPGGRSAVLERDPRTADAKKSLAGCEYILDTFKTSAGEACYSERLAGISSKLQTTLGEHFNRAALMSRLCFLHDTEGMKRLLQVPGSEGVYLRTIRIESEMRAMQTTAVTRASGIVFGDEAERPGEIDIGLDQMQKHLFIAGVTGSGKTTTILSILTELWEKHRIPFLVLEPAKSEYRLLADGKGDLAKHIRVYSPGNERLSPFRFNPLEVPAGVTVEEHISALETSFAGAIPMSGGPLPSLISESIVACFETAGFRLGDSDMTGKAWPTMKTLVQAAGKIMERRGYVGEVKANLQTAIDVRLKSLCQRSVGRMFSFERSFPSVDELLKHPTILEMDSLNLDQQNLLVLFLLTSIRERLTHKGPSGNLRHVIVLEEAHNLIGVQSAQGRVSEDFADPRGHAARFVVRLLAEIRAFGEGIMVVDQSPAAIAPEVLKNTSVKIVHRTVSEDDRDALAAAMLMDKYAHEEMARLEVGSAFVYHERLYRPTLVQCRDATAELTRPGIPALLRALAAKSWFEDGQCERLQVLCRRLNALESSLADGLSGVLKLVRGPVGKPGASVEAHKQVHALGNAVRDKFKGIIADALLDRTIRVRVKEIEERYAERIASLFETAASHIEERAHEPKKKK